MKNTACTHPDLMQEPLFSASDYISGDSFTIVKCGQCRRLRTIPVPDPAALARYYPAAYYGKGQRYGALARAFQHWLYARRASHIERMAGQRRGQALDIGCGQGHLLKHLRQRSWRVRGTELSDVSAAYARTSLGLDILVGENCTQTLADSQFDLVILWHVLEHVADPDALLEEIYRLLRPGGTLFVGVPNSDSPEAHWSQDRWFHLDVPRHLHHFGTASLRGLLESHSFTVLEAHFSAPEYDLFSALQSTLNRLGFRHNLLYNLLRRRGARMLTGEQAVSCGEVLLTLFLAPLLGMVSLLWVLLALRVRRSATVTYYARKGA